MSNDAFAWWRAALEGTQGPINADEPQCGYYRKRAGKDGPWLPVAIWMHADNMVCRVGKEMKEPLDVWTWVAKSPVKKEDAKVAFDTGTWPGDAPSVASQDIGANNPPIAITDLIPLEIEAADAWLGKVKTITTQEHADIASNRVANLRDLRKKADAEHTIEKAPHLAAGRAVDAKFRIREDLDPAVKRLLAAITVFQNAERARLQKIADDKAAKERAAWEQQQAKADTIDELLSPPPPPKAAAPVKIKSGGASGKAISLRTIKIATITDYAAVLNALKDHPDLKVLVQTLCDRACKAGVPLAGVEYSTEQVAA